MRWLSLCAALALAALSFYPHQEIVHAAPRLTIEVTPHVAFAPANIVVTVMVEPDEENRFVQVVAESDDMYRASEAPTADKNERQRFRFELRRLVRGDYTVTAFVKGTSERILASIQQTVQIS